MHPTTTSEIRDLQPFVRRAAYRGAVFFACLLLLCSLVTFAVSLRVLFMPEEAHALTYSGHPFRLPIASDEQASKVLANPAAQKAVNEAAK